MVVKRSEAAQRVLRPAGLALLTLLSAVGAGAATPYEPSHDPVTDTLQDPGGAVVGPGSGDLSLLGGPTSVGGQIEEDDQPTQPAFGVSWLDRSLEPYFRWKRSLSANIGFAFGSDYTAIYSVATSSRGEDQAAGGMWRFFGSWALLGSEDGAAEGSLVYKFENRHRIGTAIAPIELGSEIGSVLPTTVAFSDAGWLITNLYWQQRFLGGRVSLVAGQVDPTDYVDVYALVSPWTAFTNFAFSTDPSIAIPDQGLGAALGIAPTDHLYLVAGFSDPNGDPARPFDAFFRNGEFFRHLELGFVSSFARRYLDNVHVTAWQVDAREDRDVPAGWGAAFSGSWLVDDRWLPFLRGGYSRGGAALLDGSVAAGVGVRFRGSDLLGLGFAWGRPSGDGLRDQYTTELFYRLQVLPSLSLTPDIQVVVDPALEPGRDVVAVFGLRARVAL